MKKMTVHIAVLMAAALLFTACGKKTITIEDFEGKWRLIESTTYNEENLANFSKAVQMDGVNGGISIHGDRITLYRNLEYDMPHTDFCTFDVKDGKMIVHDLEVDDFMTIGDFEADFTLEDDKLTLTEGNTTIILKRQ